MFAPVVPQAMADLKIISVVLSEIVVSVFVLGFAIGPLVISPLSELYGRRWVFLISALLFLIFNIACAVSSSLNMLIVFRFLAGCAGSTPVTLGGAAIGDMFVKEKRGGAMALWAIGPQLGPAIGPIIGGFMGEVKGWRWIFWFQAILGGVVLILGTIIIRESYAPVILERKIKALIHKTGDQSLRPLIHEPTPLSQIFTRAILRPMKMLLTSPIVFLLSVYTAVIFGYLYLFITTFPAVFQVQYGFTTGVSGLTYLGLGVGSLIGVVIVGATSDKLYQKLTAKNNGVSAPEFRLPPLMLTSPLVAVSFFAYGWSAEAKVHWVVPIIFTALFSMGMMPAFVSTTSYLRTFAKRYAQMSVNMYLVDVFGQYSASALAASKVLQSLVGAFLPLAGKPLYNQFGLGWGNSVLGFIALSLAPIPWLFFKYGEKLRTKFELPKL